MDLNSEIEVSATLTVNIKIKTNRCYQTWDLKEFESLSRSILITAEPFVD